MFAQLFCILVLVGICYSQRFPFDIQAREHRCVYRCRESEYDLGDMDKRLTLVISNVNDLITLKQSSESFTRGINSLASKILKLERGNELLKQSFEKEKAMRVSLQKSINDQEVSLGKIQVSLREMKAMIENSEQETENAKNILKILRNDVKNVLKNETFFIARLNSLESSNMRTADLIEEGKTHTIRTLNNISAIIPTILDTQLKQERHLNQLEDQIQSFRTALSKVRRSGRTMSSGMGNLTRLFEDVKQKQLAFAEVLKNLATKEPEDDKNPKISTIHSEPRNLIYQQWDNRYKSRDHERQNIVIKN